MKLARFFILLFSLIILMLNCEEGSNNEIGTDPIIHALHTHYIAGEKSLFLAVETDDPQGYEDVKTVVYWMYFTPAGDSLENEAVSGALLDDGESGDIISGDGAFSKKFFNMEKGIYRFVAEAFDMSDHASTVAEDTLIALDNFPPEIYLYSAPESFEKGDTITFEIKVTDPEGIDDIFYVKVRIEQPDGTLINRIDYLRDDGLLGDREVRDGIYSISFPTNQASKSHGFWKFHFEALDKARNSSNSLSVTVKNPGLAVLYPDGGESFLVGDEIELKWDSVFLDTIVVSYTTSSDGENPDINIITEQPSYIKSFSWTIPAAAKTETCRIYIYHKNHGYRSDFSDNYFEVK
ncbi:MAG: hypothetical protein JXQ65_12710 [Candidatus Marinimicrobia bacterium]|nr:hypothetical protein [Candidatus Neomarinimicrobiota bacterium]